MTTYDVLSLSLAFLTILVMSSLPPPPLIETHTHRCYIHVCYIFLAILTIKGYVELYVGKIQKVKVCYQSVPTCTHLCMVLIVISSIAFHISIWSIYHGKSILIMFLIAMFIFNFCLLVPTSIQNFVSIVILTFFLQEYK